MSAKTAAPSLRSPIMSPQTSQVNTGQESVSLKRILIIFCNRSKSTEAAAELEALQPPPKIYQKTDTRIQPLRLLLPGQNAR